MDKNYTIRLEKKGEERETETAIRNAFYNVYRKGCVEHFLLHELRKDKDFIKELNFVMEKDGKIIGQACSVKAEIKGEKGSVPIMTLGPICIIPEYQGLGYGKILLDYVLKKAEKLGYGAVCLEGDFRFYGESGFVFAKEKGLKYHGLPEGADSSFFLCKELKPHFLDGVTGEYQTPKCYFIDDKKADEYDDTFPPKEKIKKDGQIF